jgi:exodeoxyribonuclease VII small subunit
MMSSSFAQTVDGQLQAAQDTALPTDQSSDKEPVNAGSKEGSVARGATFESLLKELEALTARLEGNQLPLEDAIAAYERGMLLQKACLFKLEEAKVKIETVLGGGAVLEKPMEGGTVSGDQASA